MTIAINKSFQALQETMANKYPQYNIILYDTVEDCFDAVKNGEADILMQNSYVTNYILQSPYYEELKTIPSFFLSESSSIVGLNDEESNIIISIINKTIATFNDSEINDTVIANTVSKPYKLSFMEIVYKYQAPLSVIVGLVFICVCLFFIIYYIRQKHINVIEKKNILLAEAVEQAQSASVAKSQFLSRMSHEIRTPMNAISGFTTIAKEHINEPNKIDMYLDKIKVASKLLLHIINDVLDMSAIESAKLKIAKDPFDLKEILKSLSSIYYLQCKQKGITFEMNIVNMTHEFVIGDELRINQILINIISNSYKFTEPGGNISVTVSQKEENNNKVFISFVIKDNGCGMKEEMLQRIFKPFEQESANTAQKYGGSGLGMSITKNLVDMMHGTIIVESELKKGSMFTVNLSLEIDNNKENNKTFTSKDLKALIMYSDDNEREYMEIVLNKIGTKFDSVSNEGEAIEIINKAYNNGNIYDICFLDWRMAESDRKNIISNLRQHFENKIVIIVADYNVSDIEEDAINMGVDKCISKPLFQSTILNILMSLSRGKYTKLTTKEGEYDFSGKKALLVEDYELNREVAVSLLNMVNLEVVTAENGEEAVKIFSQANENEYDVILMDVQMPIMDGYTATRLIRKLDKIDAKTIPIYAMTANAFTEDVTKAMACGMNGHIAKPIDTKVLYSTLDKCFKGEN